MKITEDGKTVEMDQQAETIYVSVTRRVDEHEVKRSVALTSNSLNYATVLDTVAKLLEDLDA